MFTSKERNANDKRISVRTVLFARPVRQRKEHDVKRRKLFQSLRSVIRLTSIATGVVSIVIHHTVFDALQKEKIKQVRRKNKYRTEQKKNMINIKWYECIFLFGCFFSPLHKRQVQSPLCTLCFTANKSISGF